MDAINTHHLKLIMRDVNDMAAYLKMDSFDYTMDDVNQWIKTDEIIGYQMTDGGQLVGFIYGIIESETFHVQPFGFVIDKQNADVIAHHLFKACSTELINKGIHDFAFSVLGNKIYEDVLLNLGFAYEQDYGVLDINTYRQLDSLSKLNVRMVSIDDEKLLTKMADIIIGYQNDSPVFGTGSKEVIQRIRTNYGKIAHEEDEIFYIGEDRHPVCFQGYDRIENDYFTPNQSIELSIAGTFKNESNKGYQKALMNHTMHDLKLKGYRWVMLDWRITNISSRRFWQHTCHVNIWKRRMRRIISNQFEWGNFSDG